jgi:hypothetical protein
MPPSNQFPAPVQPPSQPQQPQDPDQTPYDFFMDQQQSRRRNPFSNGFSPKLLIFGAIGFFVVLMVVALALAATSKQKAPPALLSVAQHQQEIIRLSTEGIKVSKSDTVLNLATTLQLTVTSDQDQVLTQLAHQGVKAKEKTLAADHSAQTDQALSAALASNTYDTTYLSIVKTELDKYQDSLDNAATAAKTQSELKLVQKEAANAKLLVDQVPNQ